MGVGAGLHMYDVVVKKFTFAKNLTAVARPFVVCLSVVPRLF